MKSYAAYCFDLDGTVYNGHRPIDSAIRFIQHLQNSGREPYYLTNNASVDSSEVKQRLARFGINAQEQHIITASTATASYCQKIAPNGRFYIQGEPSMVRVFERAGLTVTKELTADYVVVGIDREATYASLSDTMNVLLNGATFIATNTDRIVPTSDGFAIGNGTIVEMLAFASQVSPVVVGKPETMMLEMVQQHGGFEKEQMVMIGDNYDTDILSGIRFGIDTIHVETGVHSSEEVMGREIPPTYAVKQLVVK